MYTFLGITLVLALLLTINATATMLAAGFGRLCRPLLRKCSARTRAEILFVMRIGPPAVAIVAIFVFMIPSYLAYEPHATDDDLSYRRRSGDLAWAAVVARYPFITQRLVSHRDSDKTRSEQGPDICPATLISDHRCRGGVSAAIIYCRPGARIVE
jgi:hypothetical protein